MNRFRAAAVLSLAFGLARPAASAGPQDVVAVLSSSAGPYQSALDGFIGAFGRAVPSIRLPARPTIGPRTRVVVALGGEAAVQSYPEDATLIVCLAPGRAARLPHRGPVVFLSMRPEPRQLVSELRRLQPALKRLAVLSNPRDAERYFGDLGRAGSEIGIEVVPAFASGPEAVPDALRAVLASKADALWLAPDPVLVTPETFQTIKQFSIDNKMPFYAPTRDLAVAGASAALSAGAEETGRQAAALARRALAGETLPEVVYSLGAKLTVNLPAARKSGLSIPAGLGKNVEVLR